jgi:hypothetical protein
MTATISPLLGELTGVWRRTLLVDDAGREDERSDVVWLQAGSSFVDLRRPPGRPSFDRVAGVSDLGDAQREWAMGHQGFAGTLVVTGGVFEWRRAIDLLPPGPVPDAGRLRLESGLLVETGVHADYIEHWVPQPVTPSPVWTMRLRDNESRPALLIRVGDHFGWARGRLPRAQEDFFDCEIALGRITGASWRIEASSLPFREGDHLAPRLVDGVLETADRSSHDGSPTRRSWLIEDEEGGARL